MNDEILSVSDDLGSTGVLVDFEQAETVTSTGDPVTVNVYLPVAAEPVEVDEEERETVQMMSLDDGVSALSEYSLDFPGRVLSFNDSSTNRQQFTAGWFIEYALGPYHGATYTIDDSNSGLVYEVPVPGLAGLDYPWLMSCLLITILLTGFFSVLRVVLKGGSHA